MKRALVTGSGAGIGAAIAAGLHGAGYFVGVLDRDGNAANTVAAKLENSIAIEADIAVRRKLYSGVEVRLGEETVLAPVAGGSAPGPQPTPK